MKATIAFLFFMLFLAGLLLVNLRNVQENNEGSQWSPVDLIAVAWRPTHLGEMPLPDDTRMRLQFDADGQLSGDGGCNRFSGGFQLDGEKLTIGPVAATRMACPEPIQSFEFSYYEALQAAQSVQLQDDRLVLRDNHGQPLVRFIAEVRLPAAP